MYLIALKHVQINLGANSYIEIRKLLDVAMRNNYRYVLYIAVCANLSLLLVNVKNPGGIIFITATIAFIALIAEILLTLKGSLPINDVINKWSADNCPVDWTEYRRSWFRIFRYRELVSIAGFVSLLTGIVFKNS